MSDTIEITEATILENRRRWAEALRSGDYQQGQSQLVWNYGEKNPSYCCLGVATLLCGHDLVKPLDGTHTGGRSYLCAQEPTIEALGLDSNEGRTAVLDEEGDLVSLSTLNDSYGFTFAEIADLIDDGQVLLHIPGGAA